MKSEEEIREELEELRDDERLTEYGPANVRVNAPLALHQAAGEAKMSVLEWVLEDGGQNE